ncbi:hypothetical protein PACTADRAFT_45063 [Pachysolen tannophilus NRRL Y-2460]|uniref:Protein phosphatase methylesterase 1 n=1 Tax=Pachysolen tannophilus NRRL Y-2460 TaxID=669874 RepID=A0A1E4TR74_PACTA|nr:hypothetical protein PACTADRAFT_45063 [Pachysolen tannophilus NRRL Y-2460]
MVSALPSSLPHGRVPASKRNSSNTQIKGKEDLAQWDKYFKYNEIYTNPENNYKYNTYFQPPFYTNDNPLIFVCHHGAGSSGLTFALLSEAITKKFEDKNKRMVQEEDSQELPGIFSFDLRGHARTESLNQPETDFSMDSFSKDFAFILTELVKKHNYINPSIFLVGHSLGGSVLTNVLVKDYIKDEKIVNSIKGLTMLDIVEEVAIQSLHAMVSYLDKTPKHFDTIEDCIKWHMKVGLVNNLKSAQVSIPALFKYNEEKHHYEWIAKLYNTQPYWNEWFDKLSFNFTSIKSSIAKLLILSGHDNLDKYLMIGQMQGKYQLIVFQSSVLNLETGEHQRCGHFVQEDCPEKVAISLLDFIERNDVSRNEKKINIKWGKLR